MNLSEAYARLRARFGTHSAAAQYLGMTLQHYNALRKGRVNMPRRTADYILLKAAEIDSEPSHTLSADQANS